ncbi:TPA: phosphoadenosine phosphosulfate reductase family protein [Vibrio parahaemolyticus]|nr:phosphoadenosine phosphosulfate reductase family protein [Vibrio parahaemolyticus]
MDYLVTCSGGNDSVALLQYMHEKGYDFGAVYNDTGWANEDWPARIARVSLWCFDRGIPFFITPSEGMENLVKRKKGWPMPASNMQFCTEELKEKPTCELLQRLDPTIVTLTVTGRDNVTITGDADWSLMHKVKIYANKKDSNKNLVNDIDLEVVSGGDLTVVTGRRREESQNRADLPEWQDCSRKHGGREVFNPLYKHTEEQRDELIYRAGFEPLPHSSKECDPCVCANKDDLAELSLSPKRIDQIEAIEINMGFTSNGKPRTMFRPYRVGGGVGIRQAVEWGCGGYGWKADHVPEMYIFKNEESEVIEGASDIAYEEDTKEGREFARQCDGGFCGS